jgi:hypothetical protein
MRRVGQFELVVALPGEPEQISMQSTTQETTAQEGTSEAGSAQQAAS